MMSNRAFEALNARHIAQCQRAAAEDPKVALLRALGLTRADLLSVVLRPPR